MSRVGHPGLTLATCILASSLAFIDGSVVNVGLPAIRHGLQGNAADLQWVVGGYLLPLSALLLLGGSLGDRYGRRRMLAGGVLVFALASAGCGLAPSLPVLVAARLAQGCGAAMVMPSSLALLSDTFRGEARGRAIGIWAASGAATAAIGPVLGGWLIDSFGWRWIFGVNIPVSAAAIAMAVAFVPRDRRADAAPLDGPAFDGLGAALATAGLAGLTWGLIIGTGPRGWTQPAAIAAATGAVLIAAFILWERHEAERAMLPLALFASPPFIGLSLFTLLLYGALGGLLVLLPYVLIEAAGYSSLHAGAAILPLPLILATASPLAGSLAGRIGPRPLLMTGPVIVAAGLAAMLRLGHGASYWSTVFPALLLISCGMGCSAAPLTTAVLANADPAHTGSASGFNSAIARTGGLVATALLGGVLAARGAALVAAFHASAIVAACACLLAALSATLLETKRRR